MVTTKQVAEAYGFTKKPRSREAVISFLRNHKTYQGVICFNVKVTKIPSDLLRLAGVDRLTAEKAVEYHSDAMDSFLLTLHSLFPSFDIAGRSSGYVLSGYGDDSYIYSTFDSVYDSMRCVWEFDMAVCAAISAFLNNLSNGEL